MACADPRQAVVEHLVAPAGKRIDDHVGDPGAHAGPVPVAYAGKPYQARPGTIEVLKQRGLADRRLFAVVFDDVSGTRWSYLVAAEHNGDGWVADGVAGGSHGPAPSSRRPPASARPSIDIYGQWGADRLYLGGELEPGAAAVGDVRVTLADGTQMTDDGAGGVVLFVGRAGAQPVTVEIFDVQGRLLVSQTRSEPKQQVGSELLGARRGRWGLGGVRHAGLEITDDRAEKA